MTFYKKKLIFQINRDPWRTALRTGLLLSPCFPNFLARTTFVLVSLSEVKIPGQDAIFGDFVFNSSKMQERGGKG